MQMNIYSTKAAFSLSRGASANQTERGQPCPPPGPAAARSAKPALLCLLILWLHVVGLPPAAAQPRIIAQPRNASVLLGQDAQFGLSASSTRDLTFQWWFVGRALAGATNLSVTVTNVALSSLGRYEVVVTDSAGQVTSAPAWLLLARWTELVVFGRGHDLPRCGGLVWQNYLANRLGVRLRNYAEAAPSFDPSIVPSSLILSQIERYLSSSAPTMNTLVGLWQGSVDVMFGMPVEEAVSNQLALMRVLVDAGARSFLLPTMWPPELIPFWVANPDSYLNLTSEVVAEYNTQVSEGLKALQAEHALTIYRPDMFAYLKAVSENPAAYGFREPLGLDFICNGLHFTTAVHRLSSEEFYRLLTPPPLRMDSPVRTPGGNVVLNWSGGSPPFRIECTTDLLSGRWEPVGELGLVPSATVKAASPQEFFRVLNLGQ